MQTQTSGVQLKGPQLKPSILSEAGPEPPPFPPDPLLPFPILQRWVNSLQRGCGAGAQLCASVPPAWLGHSPLSRMLAEAELWISAIWLRVKQSRQKPWCLAVLKDWSTVPAPSVERLPSLSLQVGCRQCSPSPGYPNSSKLLFHSAPPRRSHFSQISFLQDLPQVIFIPAIPGLI